MQASRCLYRLCPAHAPDAGESVRDPSRHVPPSLPPSMNAEVVMRFESFASATISLEYAGYVKRAAPILLLALFWCWETWRPFFGQREGRLRHAGRNLAVAVLNTVVTGLLFGHVTVWVAGWAERNQFGLLNVLAIEGPVRFALALVLLDGWMYVWHRANHTFPLLWRFHRMHHSDRHMDVTTATRFHLGEHLGSSVLRLGLIPLLGLEVWNLVVYDTLVVAGTQFHHADISLGRWDRWLRTVVVTPHMHKIHHSDRRDESDSNYSTILSGWDRLARSFRMRDDPEGIVFGLKEFADPGWQHFVGMWMTPLIDPKAEPRVPPPGLTTQNEACKAVDQGIHSRDGS